MTGIGELLRGIPYVRAEAFELQGSESRSVFAAAIVIAFAGLCGHVAIAQEPIVPVISLVERLKTLRAGIEEGGYLACDDNGALKKERYESCAAFRNLADRQCFGETTADMANAMTYGRACDEIDLLQKARPPTVEYFNVESPGWWKSLPASIVPSARWMEEEKPDRSAAKERLHGKLLGDLEIAENQSGPDQVVLIFEKWNGDDGCGEYRGMFALRIGVLADFDGDGVAELRIHGHQRYESDDCLPGSISALEPGFAITLKKTSPEGPIRVMDQ